LSMSPKKMPAQAPEDLSATLFFSLSAASAQEPLGEHVPALRVLSDTPATISYWIIDEVGSVFSSPPLQVTSRREPIFNPVSETECENSLFIFAPLIAKKHDYAYRGRGAERTLKFPVRPYGVEVQAQSAFMVNLRLDDLCVFNPCSQPQFWRRELEVIDPIVEGENIFRKRNFFCRSDSWGVDGLIGVMPSYNMNSRANDLMSLEKNASKAKSKYLKAISDLQELKKLDRNSLKTLADFFDSADREPQMAPIAQVEQLRTDEQGFQAQVVWSEHPQPTAWQRFGSSCITLKAMRGPKAPKEWIPLHRGIVGLRLHLWCSSHFDTYLRLIFEDDEGRNWSRDLPLDQTGAKRYDLLWHYSDFTVTEPKGKRLMVEASPKMVSLDRIEWHHSPTQPKHEGEQILKIYPPKWIIDRKVLKSIPEDWR
jgi:hypothetical protein